MSFLSREEFKQLANADPDKLYDYLTEKFNALESRIKELEARQNQNSKNIQLLRIVKNAITPY